MDAEQMFKVETLNSVVKVHPMYLGNNMMETVLAMLEAKHSGVTCKNGFIRPMTIKIRKINSAAVELFTCQGYVNVRVSFECEVFLPPEGSLINCVVRNTNSFGVVLAAVAFEKDIMHVIVPKALVPDYNANRHHVGAHRTVKIRRCNIAAGQDIIYALGQFPDSASTALSQDGDDDGDEGAGDEGGGDDNSDFEIDIGTNASDGGSDAEAVASQPVSGGEEEEEKEGGGDDSSEGDEVLSISDGDTADASDSEAVP
jgi:DNA-directed RNA polymerase subunit E'/Rpb7